MSATWSSSTTAQPTARDTLAAAAGAEVIRHPANRGKGAAIRSGLAAIQSRDFSHVLLLDGDMQHAPDDAPRLVEAARRTNADFVIGERPFDPQTMPRSRYYTNTISSWVISTCFIGQRIADAQSGYRLIRTDTLRPVKLSSRGYEIETEMLIKLARRGARIARVPVGLHYLAIAEQIRGRSATRRARASSLCGTDSSRSDSSDDRREPASRDGTPAA